MKIVVLDGYALNPGDLSWGELEELGTVTVYERTAPDLVVKRAQGAQAVLTNKTPLPAGVLQQLHDLAYIGVLATGYDVVDARAALRQGICLSNVPAYGTDSVAQFVIALLLELCHRVGDHSQSVLRGKWGNSKDWCFWDHPQVELAGKTFGIVGAGRIGIQTARIAQALGMRVIGVNSSETTNRESPFHGFTWVDKDTLFRQSDVISLHCPLTADTQGMINTESLNLMKRSAFLINTARGKLIQEQHLADALRSGVIAGAALDVLSVEPPPSSNPLLDLPNCIITPHIAWATKEARQRLMQIAIHNVKAFQAGKPVNVVH